MALELYQRLRDREGLPEELHLPIDHALETIFNALRLYGKEGLVISFNGGKDATVVLYLARAAYASWTESPNSNEEGTADHHNSHKGCNEPCFFASEFVNTGPTCVYWDSHENFREEKDFVHECQKEFSDISLKSYEYTGDFKRDLRLCLQDTRARAFVMGTRRSDPNGVCAERFEPSSDGWPPFMRINPILDWTYANVWDFLRHLNLRYCELYDRGYTSIGAIANTSPNPRLKNNDDTYRPAYELKNGLEERLGRWDKAQIDTNAARVKAHVVGYASSWTMVNFGCVEKYLAILEHHQFEIADISLEMTIEKVQDKMVLASRGNFVFVFNFDTKASAQSDIIDVAIGVNQSPNKNTSMGQKRDCFIAGNIVVNRASKFDSKQFDIIRESLRR